MGGGREVQERGDICVLMVDAGQKPTHYCKAIILQLKIDNLKKKHPEETEWVLTLISSSVMSIEPCPSEGEMATAESLPASWLRVERGCQ